MKVALVLTGHMRCWDKVFPNTKERIIDRWNPDIFISTWNNEGYWTSPENDPKGLGYNDKSPMLDTYEVSQTYKPKLMETHDYRGFKSDFEKLAATLQPLCKEIRAVNIVSQFYKIWHGYALMQRYIMKHGTRYDWVIRMRPDLILNGDLPELSGKNPRNDIFTLKHPNHEGNGTGDMLLIAGYQHSMDFASRLTRYAYYAEIEKRFCPHLMTELLIDILPNINSNPIELTIPKVIMHTPNGQYQDFKP